MPLKINTGSRLCVCFARGASKIKWPTFKFFLCRVKQLKHKWKKNCWRTVHFSGSWLQIKLFKNFDPYENDQRFDTFLSQKGHKDSSDSVTYGKAQVESGFSINAAIFSWQTWNILHMKMIWRRNCKNKVRKRKGELKKEKQLKWWKKQPLCSGSILNCYDTCSSLIPGRHAFSTGLPSHSRGTIYEVESLSDLCGQRDIKLKNQTSIHLF